MTPRRLILLACLLLPLLPARVVRADVLRPKIPEGVTRPWPGPDWYANRVQDWRIHAGRLECLDANPKRPMRVAHWLTARLDGHWGKSFDLSVRIDAVERDVGTADTWAGFLIGVGGPGIDPRLSALVHHRPAEDGGLVAAVDGAGHVTFRDNEKNVHAGNLWTVTGPLRKGELETVDGMGREGQGFGGSPFRAVDLVLTGAYRKAASAYDLHLRALDAETHEVLSSATLEAAPRTWIESGIALVSHLGPGGSTKGYAFERLRASGGLVSAHPELAFGPVLSVMYTVSGDRLKLTAQLPPLGEGDPTKGILQVQPVDASGWETVAETEVVPDAWTLPFRVARWSHPPRYAVPYRVVYAGDTFEGVVRAEPTEDGELVLAAFTGNKHFTGGLRWNDQGVWFPHADLVKRVLHHDPDLLFFSGDQIYEGDLTGAQRRPLETAILDYHDKWRRFCWAFRALMRDRPTVAIPDDHDVYHGNLWGAGGRKAKRQDDGGYLMPARFVRMVETTQTSHLPDPHDPTPVEQGIGVYYTRLDYGGVSFAVLEDRKFKSSPTRLVPEGKVRNGWFQDPEFDPAKQADVEGAALLGERQLAFLREWTADDSKETWMKVVLSQTVFSNVATIPERAKSGGVLAGLKPESPDAYPTGYKLAADADSNGWPPSGRNRALRAMGKAAVFHVAGDQHLGSLIRYGLDAWDDAGFAFCVPSIANAWPRRWYPPAPGGGRDEGSPPYTGRFRDGFGNRMTVYAVSNPVISGREPARLHDHAPGYGIVRFRRPDRTVVVECWPRHAEPWDQAAHQYPGWPRTLRMDEEGALEIEPRRE